MYKHNMMEDTCSFGLYWLKKNYTLLIFNFQNHGFCDPSRTYIPHTYKTVCPTGCLWSHLVFTIRSCERLQCQEVNSYRYFGSRNQI